MDSYWFWVWVRFSLSGGPYSPSDSSFLTFPETSRMRRILTSVVLVVLLFPSLAFGETMDDLVKRDGIHYKKFTDVPFTGKVTGKKQGKIRNGKQTGPWVYYDEYGQVSYKGTYKDGREVGAWFFYDDNGQIWSRGTYKDGEKDGPWFEYHDNGNSYLKNGSSRTGSWTVLGSITTTTDSYNPKEPTRTGRETVLGSVTGTTDS